MDQQKPGKVLPISSRRKEALAEPDTQRDGDEGEENLSYQELLSRQQAQQRRIDVESRPPLRFEEIALTDIAISPFQTRAIGGEDELEELKNSIKSRGVIQPIVVRPMARSNSTDVEGSQGHDGVSKRFELIAGERRLKAARLAGLSTVPALIQPVDDRGSVELMIIENAQRENLNPIEEAEAYRLLADRFKLSHGDIAQIVGKNRATVSNSIRLLQLDVDIIELLKNGELTAGHGRALLMIEDSEWQRKLGRLAVKKALSVRALEGLVSRLDEAEETDEPPSEEELRAAQSVARTRSKIGDYLGIERVSLNTDTQGRRRLTLSFDTEASWKRFLSKIRE